MYTLKIENKTGAVLKLSQNESKYQILKIDGLTSPDADITSSILANMHGEKFKSSRIGTRNIVINLKLNGTVEENRIALYDFFDVGEEVKLFYQNGTRNVFINGYCEKIDGDFFSQKEEVQVSILCLNPFFKNVDNTYIDISQTFDNFEFPFAISEEGIAFSDYFENRETTIINSGEIETGVKIVLTSTTDNVLNPVIYNVNTNEFLKLNTTLNNGDEIIINTNKGEKSITKIINGISQNEINSLENGSSWFQLAKGKNLFTYQSEENQDALRVVFEFNNQYKGV